MKFGLTLPYGPPEHPGAGDPEFTLAVVRRAEELGFESVWGGEHVVKAVDYAPLFPYAEDGRENQAMDAAYPDPLVWLAWLAGQTSTIRLGTSVIVLPQRQPAILAKQVATLDRFCAGRLILGVGLGWQREESEACGFPFTDRGRRTDEFITAMRRLWTEREASFHGRWVGFDRVYSQPKPARSGGPPIIIGGHSEAAAARAGRLADGMFALVPGPDAARALRGRMESAARDAGRDPARLELTVGRPPDVREVRPSEVLDEVKAYRDAGADRLILFRLFDTDPDGLITELETFAGTVIDKL
ncbi:MAG TPA: LLM class F420-dependent oxidoreductase [Pseudonocardia sp.]|jgi:probable F420-dependent oxidoreductase